MSRSMILLALLAALTSPSFASAERYGSSARLQANPIRKVVTMLQAMQKKVTAEGEKEKELYEKFMCYCKGGTKELEASVDAAETKVPAVSSDIEETEGKLTQLKSDLKSAQTSRSEAKDAVATAKAIREKEAAAFAAEKAEYDANIGAVGKAITSLSKGMEGSFLQGASAQTLKKLALSQDMLDADRRDLTAFLAGSQTGGYAPQSGQITGILKQMSDTMKKSLADATSAEEDAIKSFEEMVSAKTKEIGALTSTVEVKTGQIGDSGVELVQMKEDLSDTEEKLLEDKKFLSGLETSCKRKTKEWEVRSRTRSEEMVALADTIKVLNDDDALELFKKTLPSPSSSFVQLGVSSATMRTRALDMIHRARKLAGHRDHHGLDFLALALTGKKVSFEKVIKMCDEMVEVLTKEQTDDDNKKEYCATQFDLSDDKKKSLDRTVSDQDNAIAVAEEGIEKLKEEITALEAGIKDLDKSVAEATEQRKEEHSDYKELMASDSAAKELMNFAKNRLNKFYNPKLYKPPAKRELSSEDRIVDNMGGEVATTTPGGIAGTGVTVLAQVHAHSHRSTHSQAPPPDTWEEGYQKKSEESTGVIGMIDLLIKDLDKEMTEAETEEKDAQADYETMMKDAAEKRTADSKSLEEKESAKADLESALEDHKVARKDAAKELMATLEYIHSLHLECDWLVQNFETRKEARAGEIDSLKKAKAVLSGADYALMQTQRKYLRQTR